MKIHLLTINHKMPAWIQEGFEEYVKRLPPSCMLELIEIPALKRTANIDLKRLIEREGEKLLAAVKPNQRVIALDINGKGWTTEKLAKELAKWQQDGRQVNLLIGGPDGLSPSCLQKADEVWSLSPLTFPHGLVRIIVAEQIYRAFSLLKNHPYHRG